MIPALPPARFAVNGAFAPAYYTSGPPNGRPVMLVHGLCSSGLQFVADARAFAERGHFVIVPDLRGHGRSRSDHRVRTGDFTLERMASDLVAILDDLGVARVDFVGNSLGGILGLRLVADTAHRLASLATFGTAYALELPAYWLSLGRWTDRIAGRRLVAHFGALTSSTHAHAREVIKATLQTFDLDAALAAGAHARSYDLIEMARRYRGPVLMIRGGEDRLVNAALGPTLEAMRDRPNFTLVDLPRAGHCANLDRPQDVRETLEAFWGCNRLPLPGPFP